LPRGTSRKVIFLIAGKIILPYSTLQIQPVGKIVFGCKVAINAVPDIIFKAGKGKIRVGAVGKSGVGKFIPVFIKSIFFQQV
jgi:hypothetical protein